MVSRTYWPHLSSDVASRTLRLADGLARAGVQIDVLTPRYASSWPDRICHREIVVHRPAAAPRSEWSMGRYLRHIESWLRENSQQYDVLYSATMREEAAIVVETARRNGAVSVLQHAGAGKEADTLFQAPIRHRRRLQSAIRSANAIVVSRASSHQTLLSVGISRDRIHRVPTGVWPGKGLPGRDSLSRQQSRQCLAAVNGDLSTDRDSLVVVSVGSMHESSGIVTLAQSIPSLINVWPDLRFWLIGDGPLRNELHRYFKHHGVRQNVAMPGTFVDYSDVLAAADLFVQPSVSDAIEDFVPQAIATPLPLVIADGADTRAMFGEFDDCVHWCSEGDTDSLTHAIRRTLGDLGPAQTASERLRREFVQRKPYADTINGFLDLFSKLSGKPILNKPFAVESQAST
jgi:glycosyltransferase involved in cell wall biosynthesis